MRGADATESGYRAPVQGGADEKDPACHQRFFEILTGIEFAPSGSLCRAALTVG
jgi:hypothetical protein